MKIDRKAVCRSNMIEAWRLESWERIAQVVFNDHPDLTVDEIATAVGAPADLVYERALDGKVLNDAWQAGREAQRRAMREQRANDRGTT